MSLDMDFIRMYNLEFLMNNIYGLYLPLFITLVFFIKTDVLKKFLNFEIFILFVVSAFFCTYLSEVLYVVDESLLFTETGEIIHINENFEGLFTNNYFPAIYLFWFGLVKKDLNFNIPLIWCGSFLTLWISDIIFAYFKKGEHLFSSNIGGAGLFDGLLVDPIFATISVIILSFFINLVIKNKDKKEKSIAKTGSY